MTLTDEQQGAQCDPPNDHAHDAPNDPAHDAPGRGPTAPPWARGVTRGLDPQNVIVGVLVLVGAVRHGWAGAGWALFAAVFAGVIPQGVITLQMRRGKVADRYVGDRAKRARMLPVVLVSVVVGLVLMAVLGAPRELIAMILAMLATLVPIILVTAVLKWKISLHTAVSGGAVAMLGVALGAWWALGYLVVGLIAWSRVVLKDHTVAQTAAGALLGGIVAGLTFRAASGL